MPDTSQELLTDPATYGRLSIVDVMSFVDHVALVGAVDPQQATSEANTFYYDYLEGYSARDTLELGAEGMLDVLAKARDIPALQRDFSANLVGGLATEFSRAEPVFFDKLAIRVTAMKPEQAIKELATYRDVTQAASGVSAEAGLHSSRGIASVANKLTADKDQPELVRIFAQTLERSAADALERPDSLMTIEGNPKAGKFSTTAKLERLGTESIALSSRIRSTADGKSSFLARLSNDSIGVVDRTGAPLKVASLAVDQERKLPSHKVSEIQVQELTQFAESNSDDFNLPKFISTLKRVQTEGSSLTIDALMPELPYDVATINKAYDTYQTSQDAVAQFEAEQSRKKKAQLFDLQVTVCNGILANPQVTQYLAANYSDEFTFITETLEHNKALGYELLEGLIHQVDGDNSFSGFADEPAPEVEAIIAARKQIWLPSMMIGQKIRTELEAYQQTAFSQTAYAEAVATLDHATEVITTDDSWELFQANLAHAVTILQGEYAALAFIPTAEAVTDKPGLFKVIHERYVRDTIEQTLGFELTSISLVAQEQAVDYLLKIKGSDFAALKQQLDAIPDVAAKAELFEAFTATEFGDDFARLLLDLAKTNGEQALPVLRMIREIRQASMQIGEGFSSEQPLDQQLAKAVPVAFIKRTTELLALARQEGLESVTFSLQTLRDATQAIAQAVKDDSFQVMEATSDHGSLRADAQPVTITARPSGNNARLGFTIKNMGEDKRQRLSIRLDYENGGLSLDIGSTAKSVNASDVSRRVGDDLAKGEQILSALRVEQGIGEPTAALNGNHVREAFSSLPYLQPEEFSGLVNRYLYRLRLADPIT